MTPEEEKSGLHATTVQLQGRGVMLMGKSGAGKTELALTLVERAIVRNEQAALVADDRTLLHVESGKLIASVPQTLAGGVEIRGAGLFAVAYVEQTPLDLVVRLVERDEAERYPSGENWHFEGIEVPRLLLPALSSNGDSNALSRAIEATLFSKPWP
jgi:serine kinase of HPr protein (carbohydrate metabolism regulator)